MNGAHRRFNPLTGSWVLVSPQRLQRPWQGAAASPVIAARPPYDPSCYLCPGNERANGASNPRYTGTFLFDNDFPALQPDAQPFDSGDRLLRAQSERGVCRVLCFSPRHDADFAQMPPEQIRAIVDAWAEEYTRLGSLPDIAAVTIFENRGDLMGASNPHPHGQIWAQQSIPDELARESASLAAYLEAHGECLLCAYVRREREERVRIVYENQACLVVVPFWAVWPFEVLLVPARHCGAIADLQSDERDALAQAIREIASRYDRLFNVPFPYSMGFHQRPTGGAAYPQWHAHAHYYPPLLRSARVRKYLVGFEMLAQPQRDLTPEEAAERLRSA